MCILTRVPLRLPLIVLGLFAATCSSQTTDLSTQALLKVAPSSCSSNSKTSFFSVPLLSCETCEGAKIASSDGYGCVCPPNYRSDPTSTSLCLDCAASGLVLSQDGNTCGRCSASVTVNVSSVLAASCYNSTRPTSAGGKCTCPTGYIITDYNSSGLVSETGKSCLLCPLNTYVASSNPYVCVQCPDVHMYRDSNSGSCTCKAGYVRDSNVIAGTIAQDIPFVGLNVCLQSSQVSQVKYTPSQYGQQTFNDVIDVDGSITTSMSVAKSQPFLKYFLQAAVQCQNNQKWEACQTLANLCTLQLFDTTAPSCATFQTYVSASTISKVHGFNGWQAYYPWLFYEDTSRTVLLDTAINRQVALSGPLSFLNITLSVYALNGTFLGFQDLTSQLLLCKGDERIALEFTRIGNNDYKDCTIDLLNVINTYGEPVFYEAWVDDAYDKLGNLRTDGIHLFPIPIVITNYQEGSTKPNQAVLSGTSVWDLLDTVVLHRRFFLWDNLSGKKIPDTTTTQSSAGSTSNMVVVRWAKQIQLRVRLQQDNPSTTVDEAMRIYPPVLVIQYQQQVTSTIPQGYISKTSAGQSLRYPKVSFSSTYSKDLSSYWRTMMILFIVYNIVMVIYLGLKFSIRNQSTSVTLSGMASDVVGVVGDFYFWWLVVMTAYWFCFYKLQAVVKEMLPTDNPPLEYLSIVIAAVVCKVLQIGLLIYEQCNVDIFFIDWEKERTSDRTSSTNPGEAAELPNVSVWRTIFMANEWCEMQECRHTSIEFTLMFVLFFMAGLNLQNLDSPQPDVQNLSTTQPNIALRFFVYFIWYAIVVIFQLVVVKLMYHFLQDPLDTFADLCQLSNISTFILDEYLHGYYIHGRSVHAHTDVNMLKMQTNFEEENQGKAPSRGLTNKSQEELRGNSDQVFEMYITDKLRENYQQKRSSFFPTGGVAARGGRTADQRNRVVTMCKAHHQINEYLQVNFVGDIEAPDSKCEILEPSLAHKIFGFPPRTVREHTVLLRDNNNNFSRVLLYGIEWQLLIFDFLVLITWDLIFQNVYFAALFTYGTSMVVVKLRSHFGSKNVAIKTLVDERFLI
mmetsp:Transcript_12006/g.41630  ORF Transcript_12006/g.41630 Transcript_12006/m.41630 type:complete len:1071 (-) Transcript_12006:2610-5822(-)